MMKKTTTLTLKSRVVPKTRLKRKLCFYLKKPIQSSFLFVEKNVSIFGLFLASTILIFIRGANELPLHNNLIYYIIAMFLFELLGANQCNATLFVSIIFYFSKIVDI